MKIILILTLSLLASANAASKKAKRSPASKKSTTKYVDSLAKDTKMPPKWYQLMHLIEEERKTIVSLGRLSPRLKYRILELESERIKLLKERENARFLSSSFEERKKYGKDKFFEESKHLAIKVMKDGMAMIKNYPEYRDNAAIYYTLALNSRDYGDDKLTEPFLHRSLKLARPDSPLIHLIKSSLAEYYYNGKKYPQAIKYYNDVLVNKKDDWYSKHLLNAAWCHFKLNNYNQAIDYMKEAFNVGKNAPYINVGDQVLEAIGVFHVYAQRVEEGVSFYLDATPEPGQYLIRMARKCADNGSFEQVKHIMKSALSNAISKENRKEQVTIHLSELEFYRNFKRFDMYKETVASLTNLHKKQPLEEEPRLEAVEKIKSLTGVLQLDLSKNKRFTSVDYEPSKLNDIIDYFDYLQALDERESDSYRYFQGETLFSVAELVKAFDAYKGALEFSKSKHEKYIASKKEHAKNPKFVSKDTLTAEELEKMDKLQRKTMDALLVILENAKFKPTEARENTLYAYENHLNLWPKEERSRLIFQKLYNLRFEKKEISETLDVIERYRVTFKEDGESQRAMLSKVIDHYVKQKDSNSLAIWINKMNTGYLSFDKPTIEKATVILGGILFENFQKMEKEGNKSEAIKGYLSLYEDKRYPSKIKANAAFNAALLALQLQDVKTSSEWFKASFKHFEKKEALKLSPKIFAFVQELVLLQDLDTAVDNGQYYFNKFCSEKFKNKNELYEIIVKANVLSKEESFDQKFMSKSGKCGISASKISQTELGLASHFAQNRNYKGLFSFYNKFQSKEEFKDLFNTALVSYYWDAKEHNLSNLEKMTWKMMRERSKSSLSSQDINNELVWADDYHSYQKSWNPQSFARFTSSKPFNEELFTQELQAKIERLTLLIKESKQLIKTGHPYYMPATYINIIDSYEAAITSIKEFTPIGMPDEYVTGFKEQLAGLADGLIKEKNKHFRNAQKVMKAPLLSEFHKFFTPSGEKVRNFQIRHPANLMVTTSDMGGNP
ncbi:MAG: hypothetical protein COW00_13300 [Bdellovibrio sp. CG12_big_fil_rev_8_21_14_0_65_39_13]|nr:MAG: hypothetical protein COW78_11350 [Bdellovibrio sp. CG22_combo_CG10-13_8_21_14_all_39_27]PIQ58906.1 MAG: hypothetical protein COW00_13300 [Bdellovibrio sp. CG12_big_fil_rev_8_21_14_0_65_39_13]PIR35997.1 MAG: hypothetical protein COV37_05675 [Bdellovibrio sp. CG11_big_fil_rev_8_21_14_0_20_39_38]PJB53434.1 MAG: hypothetical protein CO099_07140 [Bdellovibrio sp. CG_4_9_14_3_um_filter_39_7]